MFFSLRRGERERHQWSGTVCMVLHLQRRQTTSQPGLNSHRLNKTAVHRSKQSVSFFPDFLSLVLYSVIAGLKECQALYKATITCEKRKSGFDARIMKVLILQSFTESRNLPKLLGWPVRLHGKSSQLEKGSSCMKGLGQSGVHISHLEHTWVPVVNNVLLDVLFILG